MLTRSRCLIGQWSDVHIVLGTLFVITGIWQLYLNWKPFAHYWAERAKSRWRIKRELLISIVMIAGITGLAVADLPPASWISGLQDNLQHQGWMVPGKRMSQTGSSQHRGMGRSFYRHTADAGRR